MSDPYADALAKAARIVLRNPGSDDLPPARIRERDNLVEALARYEMSQEDNVSIAGPETTEDNGPTDFDVMGLVGSAKKAAALLKDIPGQGYAAEELLWFAEQVEKRVKGTPEVGWHRRHVMERATYNPREEGIT